MKSPRQRLVLLAIMPFVCHAGDSVEARVRMTGTGPQLFVDGKAVVPRMCHVAENPRFYDHLTSTVRRAKEFGDVDIVSLATHKTDACWHEDGHDDWALLDDLCDKVVRSNPEAKFFPRVRLFAPKWYLRAHPEDRVTFEDGTMADDVSPSSRRFQGEAACYLRRMITHLESRYPRHFIGVHVTAQMTGEFQYYGSLQKLDGYDGATLAAWREYLAREGEPDAATATVPTPEERRARATGGQFRDPVAHRRILQFERFRQNEMADMIAYLCHTAREATGGRKLVLAFYGYSFTLTGRVEVGAAASGHYALQRLLDKARGDIDILCSPFAYSDRTYWGGVPTMGSDETVMRAGILHLEEDDVRTYLDHREGPPYRMEGERVDKPMSLNLLRRVTVAQGIRGFASWWMDLYGLGWYDSPELWYEQRCLASWEKRLLARRTPYSADVALVVGEDSICTVSSANDPTRAMSQLVRGANMAVARAGAPCGQWLQSDVARHGVPSRLQLMLTPWCMTEDEVGALAGTKGLPEGGLRAWFWAPGLFDGLHACGPERMERVCGFRLVPYVPQGKVVEATERGRMLGLPEKWSVEGDYSPYYVPVDARDEEVLARWPDGNPAIAVRGTGSAHTAFVGAPRMTPELVRALGEIAGVHHYIGRKDIGRLIVWAADGFLSFQTRTDGPCEILLPKGVGDVFDGNTNKKVGEGGRLVMNLKAGESRFCWYQVD